LAGAFVEADGGIERIIRFFIQVQDVFHVIDDLGVYLGVSTAVEEWFMRTLREAVHAAGG